MNRENFPGFNPEKEPKRIGVPSEDDIMELGIALSIGEIDKVKDLSLKMMQEIFDSQMYDRDGKRSEDRDTVKTVEARMEGSNIFLTGTYETKGEIKHFEIKIPYKK